jgi:hypothetical protein
LQDLPEARAVIYLLQANRALLKVRLRQRRDKQGLEIGS